MECEAHEARVHLTTDVSAGTLEELQSIMAEKWLPSIDDALNRAVDFFTPTDSLSVVNLILNDCDIVLDDVESPDEQNDFFRTLYAYFADLLEDAERRDRENTVQPEETDSFPEEEEPEREMNTEDYFEEPLKITHPNNVRVPLSVIIGESQFHALKSSADAMDIKIGLLIDMMISGYPHMEDPEDQALGVITLFGLYMNRLTHEQFIESLQMITEILEFIIDCEGGIFDSKAAMRICYLFRDLDENRKSEKMKLKMWKYDNSIITTFLGFLPPESSES